MINFKRYFSGLLLWICSYYLFLEPTLNYVFPNLHLPEPPGVFGNLISVVVSIATGS